MKKDWVLGILLALAIFFGISYLLSSNSERDKKFIKALDTTPEVFERKALKHEEIQLEWLNDSDKMYSPAQVRIDGKHLYINDFSVFTLYKFDSDGNLLDSLKTTRGRDRGKSNI
ncbi:MAG TPA: hypothetical protein VLA13_09275 [Massilibacterium sp.]|nr:hypothetical protein [Massilibacterium sp.]